MSLLKVDLQDGARGYLPGQEVTGTAEWHLDTKPVAVETRLCWFTFGQVVPESRTVEVMRFDQVGADDRRPFRFRLPGAPFSYMGIYGGLSWAVELVVLPEGAAGRAVFNVSPTGAPVSPFEPDETNDENE